MLHNQGAWTYKQINDNIKTNSWKVKRTKSNKKAMPNNDLVPDQEVGNRNDDDSLSDQFIRDKNNNKTFEDESIVEDKTVSKNDLTDGINIFNNNIKEDKRITKEEEKEKKYK